MPGSSRNKELSARERDAAAGTKAAMDAMKAPDPMAQMAMDRATKFLQAYERPGMSVTDLPGLEPYLQIGQRALARQQIERKGGTGLNLGGQSMVADKLRAQMAAESAAGYAGNVEQAVAGRYAEATGSLIPLAQLNLQRTSALGSLAANRESAYLNAPRETPFWQKLALQGVQAAGSMFSFGGDKG